jgi:hypothetical protein
VRQNDKSKTCASVLSVDDVKAAAKELSTIASGTAG